MLKKSKKPVKNVVKLTDKQLLDTISDPILHNINSIKITLIDGFIHKKQQWTGIKWINLCRYDGCLVDVKNKSLCDVHLKEQKSTRIQGETIMKNNLKYKWIDDKWIQMCNIDYCPEHAKENGKCLAHQNNNISIETPQSIGSLYKQAEEEFKVKKAIEKKKKRLESEQIKLENDKTSLI